MSSFFNQVGYFGQSFSQQGAIQTSEELRVGNHSLVVKEKLAEGGFGVIQIVVESFTQQEYVLKRCNIDREEIFEVVRKEISILQQFAGPYIVKLIDSAIIEKSNRSKEALLLLEYYPGGHLLDRLNKRNGHHLPLESIFRIFGQILLGVQPFHDNRPVIVHRDLKLENILFAPDGKVKLCDFGSCKEGPIFLRNANERAEAEESILKETTQMYRSPEMVNLYMRDILTEKTDVWAMGCVLFSLCFLKHPFQDQGSLAIIAGKYQFPKDSPYPLEINVLISHMLDIDPEARPTISELVNYVVELAAGRALPLHILSQEALQRRQDRIEADKIKDKGKKKTDASLSTNSKKGSAPSANSVAAKRLAAKRGQVVVGSVGAEIVGADFNNGFEANFDSFADNIESAEFQTTPVDTETSPSWEFSNPENNFSAVAETNFWDSNSWPQPTQVADHSPIVQSSQYTSEQSFDLFSDNNLVSHVAQSTTQKSFSQNNAPSLMEFDNLSFTPASSNNSKGNIPVSDTNFLLSLYDSQPATIHPTPNLNIGNVGIIPKANYQGNSRIITQQTANKSKTLGGKKNDPFESLSVFPSK